MPACWLDCPEARVVVAAEAEGCTEEDGGEDDGRTINIVEHEPGNHHDDNYEVL